MGEIAVYENTKRVWERMRDETDKSFEAFCVYLTIPKRGNPPKRFKEDCAQELNCTLANISLWASKNNWDARADAYDNYMQFKPVEIAEIARRRELAAEYRDVAKAIREKVKEAIIEIDPLALRIDEMVKLLRVSKDLEIEVKKLEEPDVADKKQKLKSEINKLLSGLATAGVGGIAAGGSGGTLTATERKISIEFPVGDGESVSEVQECAGAICEGSSGTDVVEQAD